MAAPRSIQVYNTLTGQKEVLKPLEPGKIKMYACGVTVYDHCHIGHALQAVFFDVIRRYLTFAGYEVTYVRNYTDVDDKIINRAAQTGKNPKALAEEMIASCQADMKALGLSPASHEPRVSESIPAIIHMIEALIKNGAAYKTDDGDVYYKVRTKADYGKLSNRRPDELRSGTRDVAGGSKEDELDFALWKRDDTEGASWASPFGQGRPGWHIECSAMAQKFLGDQFDIHGGGRDLVFPHHENEIAQSESANQCPYANYWLHSGLLTINKQKMSKSLGNHITIHDFLGKWPAEVLKLAFLQQHYTSNIDFAEGVFQSCAKRLFYFYETLEGLRGLAAEGTRGGPLLKGHEPLAIETAFHEAMSQDFATPVALRDLLKHFKKARELTAAKKSPEKAHTAKAYAEELTKVCQVLGLMEQEPTHFQAELKTKVLPHLGISAEEIAAAINRRKSLRDSKDFSGADAVRDALLRKGILLMDTPQGTKWTLDFNECTI